MNKVHIFQKNLTRFKLNIEKNLAHFFLFDLKRVRPYDI